VREINPLNYNEMKNRKLGDFVPLLILLLFITLFVANNQNRERIQDSFSNVKQSAYPDKVTTSYGYTLRGHYLTDPNKDRRKYNLPLINCIDVDTIEGITNMYYYTYKNGLTNNEYETHF